LHFDGDVYEDWMETTKSPQHFQHLQHLQHQQQQTQEDLHATRLQMERMETYPSFVMFRPPKLQVLVTRPRFVKGQPFEFGLRRKLV
jgi:hypothetical protein